MTSGFEDFLDPGDDWLSDEEPDGPRKRRSPGDKPPPPEVPTVLWVPIRCPGCGNKDPKKRQTKGKYQDKARRYHKCKVCKLVFRSEEWTQPTSPEKGNER